MKKEGSEGWHLQLSSLITDSEYCELLIYDMFYSLVEGCQLPEEKTVLSFRVNNEGLTLHANAGIPTNLAKSNTVYNSCHNTHLDQPKNPNVVYRNLIDAAEEDHAVPSVWLRKVSEVLSRRQPPKHFPKHSSTSE